ncbi:unnamed protein product [Didymodactylos carnosus]|uniref:Uncharacterized protein n=1 Tax=Didymodactylos carnosus TaxID=1234261 RepID=A0A8S2E6P2_9BILA|nr:unnamed protein product [Didymodactylos carnosus]CAF3854552.1 unnamed protein product [Didymodactylos carnosus]
MTIAHAWIHAPKQLSSDETLNNNDSCIAIGQKDSTTANASTTTHSPNLSKCTQDKGSSQFSTTAECHDSISMQFQIEQEEGYYEELDYSIDWSTHRND